jgi:ribose transport system ATP-binding protein
VDVGARRELYRALWDLADQGKAVVVASSDLRELMLLCDRIAVLSEGKITATFTPDAFSEEALLAAALPRGRSASGACAPSPGSPS